LIDNAGVLDSFKLVEDNAFPGTKKRKKKTRKKGEEISTFENHDQIMTKSTYTNRDRRDFP
jgi:hypothetical protein